MADIIPDGQRKGESLPNNKKPTFLLAIFLWSVFVVFVDRLSLNSADVADSRQQIRPKYFNLTNEDLDLSAENLTGDHKHQEFPTHRQKIRPQDFNLTSFKRSYNTHFLVETSGDETDSKLYPSKITIKILSPKPPEFFDYSVTVLSTGTYTGTATLLSNKQSDEGKPLLFSWTPKFPASYRILVHEIPPWNERLLPSPTPLVEPSPYTIEVKGSTSPNLESRFNNPIPCQQVKRADIYSDWDGDWLGPEFRSSGKNASNKLRSEWTFVPGNAMNCTLETFDSEDLASIPEKRSIHILGTSRERGIFLSLVDMMLPIGLKNNLQGSPIGKCWGRATVRRGNLEILYQDWRASSFERQSDEQYMTCHDNKVAKTQANFRNNATLVLEDIFKNPSSWPNVIYMLTPFASSNTFDFEDHVKSFVTMIPTSWEGTFFLGDFTFSAREMGFISAEEHEAYSVEVRDMLQRLNDDRLRWIDGHGISKEMRLHSQNVERMGSSQHFHRPCAEKVPSSRSRMLVCSNITEMVGQLLLSHALGPRSELREGSKDNNGIRLATTYCHACPKNLIPFHLTPYPNMTCVKGPLRLRTRADIVACSAEGGICPEKCLKQARNDTIVTESDVVEVRFCSV